MKNHFFKFRVKQAINFFFVAKYRDKFDLTLGAKLLNSFPVKVFKK